MEGLPILLGNRRRLALLLLCENRRLLRLAPGVELFSAGPNPLGLLNPVGGLQPGSIGLVKVVYPLRQEETRAVTEHPVEERITDGVG